MQLDRALYTISTSGINIERTKSAFNTTVNQKLLEDNALLKQKLSVYEVNSSTQASLQEQTNMNENQLYFKSLLQQQKLQITELQGELKQCRTQLQRDFVVVGFCSCVYQKQFLLQFEKQQKNLGLTKELSKSVASLKQCLQNMAKL